MWESPIRDGSKLVSDSKPKAQLLVKQFKSIFTTDDSIPSQKAAENLYPSIINIAGVVNCLKPSTPPRHADRMRYRADRITPALAIIFQKLIDSGKLPLDWRKANMSCIFKKGDKHQAANYRPISLTSVSSKILEHIIWPVTKICVFYVKPDVPTLQKENHSYKTHYL